MYWFKKCHYSSVAKNRRRISAIKYLQRERRFIRRFHRASWDTQELSFRSQKNNLIRTQPPGHHSLHPYTPSPVYTEREREKKSTTKHPLPFPTSSHPRRPHLFSKVSFVLACTAVPRATCQLASYWMNARASRLYLRFFVLEHVAILYVIFLGGGKQMARCIYLHAPDVSQSRGITVRSGLCIPLGMVQSRIEHFLLQRI